MWTIVLRRGRDLPGRHPARQRRGRRQPRGPARRPRCGRPPRADRRRSSRSRAAVVVTMATPWSTFPQVLTTQVGDIAAPAVLTVASATPIGTGPFSYAVDRARRQHRTASGTRPTGSRVCPTSTPSASSRSPRPPTGSMPCSTAPSTWHRSTSPASSAASTTSVTSPRSRCSRTATASGRRWPSRSRPGGRRSTTSSPARAVALATDREAILEKVFDGQGTHLPRDHQRCVAVVQRPIEPRS